MVGAVAAILAAMVALGFLGTAAIFALAYTSGVFDDPTIASTSDGVAATHPSSALSTLGMDLLKTPALSADAARAFYHAARLDPADAANARMAAVACESAALVELRYDIERRALSEAEKQRARDEALTAAGDETRQAALERAARLVPSDADLRAALDAARQKRLDEIRQAFAADSAQRPVSGG